MFEGTFFWDYSVYSNSGIDDTVLVLFWELFLFRNERNAIPFILLLIAEWTEKYFGGKIAGPCRSLLITSATLFLEERAICFIGN